MLTAEALKKHFGGPGKTAKAFGVSRVSVYQWGTRGVPEHIALLCHLSAEIPYTYKPSDYGRDAKGLNLNLKKVTTNDHKPERIQPRTA